MNEKIDALKQKLADATDSKEYDSIKQAIANQEKADSIQYAKNEIARREAAEAHRKALLQEREGLLVEGAKLKFTVDDSKAGIVKAYNQLFALHEEIWAKVAKMREISRKVDTLNTELNMDDVVFKVGQVNWGGASLNGDPLMGIKDLSVRMFDLWRAANYSANKRKPGKFTDIQLEDV